MIANLTLDMLAEQAIRATERLREAELAAGFGIFDVDYATGALFWSSSLKAIYGLPVDAVVRHSPNEPPPGVHPGDRVRLAQALTAAADPDGPGVLDEEHRIVRPDGGIRWVRIKGKTSFHGEGSERRAMRATGVVLDLTERRHAEEIRRLADEAGRLGTFHWDAVNDRAQYDAALDRVYGLEGMAPMLSYGDWVKRLHPDDRWPVQHALFELFQARAPRWHGEFRIVRPDGEIRWIEARANVHYDGDGLPSECIGVHVDVTERKRVEEAMRLITERFQTALKGSPVVVFNQDADLRYTWIHNPALTRRAEGFLGATDGDLFPHPGDAERLESIKRRVIETGVGERREVPIHDGEETHYFDMTVEPMHAANSEIIGVTCAAVDITERKRAEVELRESEARFRTLADNIAQLAWMADETGGIFWYNKRWFDYTGTTLDEMRGWGWQQVHHPDHAQRVVAKMRDCFAQGAPWEDTFPLRGRDGKYRWFLSRAIPIRDGAGRLLRWFGTNTDITEQHEADQRKDEFLATLAHELRNPLAPIRNAIALAQRLRLDEPRLEWACQVIEGQVAHLTRLVDDLLDVARIARGRINLQKERIALADAVQHAVQTASPLIDDRRHALAVTLPEEPVWLDADLVRISQVLLNLLANAAKYTADGGRISLSAETKGAEVVLRVRDNGSGIPGELLPGVFDLFRQGHAGLARSNGGLGIGLTLVKRLVEMHGGRVEARSEGAGRGAEFSVWLPRAVAGPTRNRTTEARAAQTGRLRILVVDDNREASDSMAMLLELEGHQVRAAYAGESALDAARTFDPHVVLLDIGLPDLDGYEVGRRLRERKGGRVQLIALTGYGDTAARERSRAAGFDHHVVKPVDLAVLLALLAKTGIEVHGAG